MAGIGKTLILMGFAILFFHEIHGQEIHVPGLISLQISYNRGLVLPTNEFVSGQNRTGEPYRFHQSFSARIGLQTDGSRTWEREYGLPRYGAGLYAGDYRTHEIGKPLALYGYLAGPLLQKGRWSVSYDVAFGLALNLKPYNPVTNPFNTAIGSRVNGYEEGSLNLEYRPSDRLSALAGVALTHFSNGGLVPPNQGINALSVRSSIQYRLYTDRPLKPLQGIPDSTLSSGWEVSWFVAMGFVEPPAGTQPAGKRPGLLPGYSNGFSGLYFFHPFYQMRMGAGFMIDYNGIVNPTFTGDPGSVRLNRYPDLRRLESGLFASIEIRFNRFSIVGQPCLYLYRNDLLKESPVFFQRAGIKYQFRSPFFTSMMVRGHSFSTADFVEWTFGYRFSHRT